MLGHSWTNEEGINWKGKTSLTLQRATRAKQTSFYFIFICLYLSIAFERTRKADSEKERNLYSEYSMKTYIMTCSRLKRAKLCWLWVSGTCIGDSYWCIRDTKSCDRTRKKTITAILPLNLDPDLRRHSGGLKIPVYWATWKRLCSIEAPW